MNTAGGAIYIIVISSAKGREKDFGTQAMEMWRQWGCALLSKFGMTILKLWRWLLHKLRYTTPQLYAGPRMHRVRRLASGWGGSVDSRHPLAKPTWVQSAVFQLASELPNAGCRTLASSFNLAYASSEQRISKTWVYSLLKARAAALALARRKSKRQGGSSPDISP
jgi:hypothetical protein